MRYCGEYDVFDPLSNDTRRGGYLCVISISDDVRSAGRTDPRVAFVSLSVYRSTK